MTAAEPGKSSPEIVPAASTVTVADALVVPPDPVQARVNVLVTVSGPVDSPVLLEIALLPDHAPEATQELALLEDQLSVEDPPLVTEPGFAESKTVGRGSTVTVAEALALPPEPVQVRE